MRIIFSAVAALLLSGCVSLVKDVVTAPVKIVSKTADVLTTSQSEADEKRGRELRKQDERLGELARKREKAQRKCDKGTEEACREVEAIDEAIAVERNRRL